jgi:hypothetical protein
MSVFRMGQTTGLTATWESFWGYIRCYDSAGNQIGKWEAMTVVRPSAWTQLTGESGIIPRNAASVAVTFYMPPSCTGTVWMDDVVIEAIDDVIASAEFKNPNYRHTLYPGQSRNVAVAVQITDSVRHPISNLAIDASVIDSAGKTVSHTLDTCQPGKTWENIGFNLQDAAAGDYQVVLKAMDTALNSQVSARNLSLTIAGATTPPPQVFIDENNRFIVNGQPYFPLGCYINVPNASMLDTLVAAKFNCAITYNMPGDGIQVRAFFAAAAQKGIKLMFPLVRFYDGVGITYPTSWGSYTGTSNIIAGYVNTFKNEPSLLCWYLGEDLNEAIVPQMSSRYNLVKSLDPNHPTASAFSNGDTARYLAQCSDSVGLYTYPVMEAVAGTPDLTTFGNLMTKARNATLGTHSLWMAPECSSQPDYKAGSRAPRYDEMMCESYQALVGGARGLVFYYLYNTVNIDGAAQVDLLKKVGGDLSSISPIALARDADPAKRVRPVDSRVSACTRLVGSDLYILAVNSSNASLTSGFQLGNGAAASSVEVRSPQGSVTRTIPVSGSVFSDAIEARGTRIYRLVP